MHVLRIDSSIQGPASAFSELADLAEAAWVEQRPDTTFTHRHLVDSEVAHGLLCQATARRIASADGWAALDAWRRLGLTPYATNGFLARVWELRENLSAYDASYVALAEALDCSLVMAAARISRAPGVCCPITVVPR